MKARFLHVADCHLGYKQYNKTERYDDFAIAFSYIIDQAINQSVDFVVLAGDLFQKRAIEALTLQQSMALLERLQQANIPCIAVEGNHELSYYEDYLGWVQFLQQRKLLTLLDADFDEGKAILRQHSGKKGAYVDINPDLRIYGMKYRGSSTARALAAYAEAIDTFPSTDKPAYNIFIAHTGVEGVLANETGGLSHRQLATIRPHVNYLALGHVHKPFEFDSWIYNPGSPEHCSMTEVAWPERGYYLVEIDTEKPIHSELAGTESTKNAVEKASTLNDEGELGDSQEDSQEDSQNEVKPDEVEIQNCFHVATLHTNPRRPFVRISIAVDHFGSPDGLVEHCKSVVKRKARDHASRNKSEQRNPVVELRLTGVIPFERSTIQIKELETIVMDTFDALFVQIRNQTTSAEFAINQDKGLSRPQLERQVMTELLEQDVRYVNSSETWTNLILSIKNLALSGAGSENILHELSEQLTEIDKGEAQRRTLEDADEKKEAVAE